MLEKEINYFIELLYGAIKIIPRYDQDEPGITADFKNNFIIMNVVKR